MCLGQMALIATSTWYVSLGYPIVIAVVWTIQRCYLRTSRQIRFLDLEAKSPLYSHFLETLSGLATIRAFGWQEHSMEAAIKFLNNSQQPYYLLLMIQGWLSLVLDMTVAGLAVLVIGLSIAVRQSVSIGFTAVALVSLISFGDNVKVLVKYWTQTETSMGALVRIKTFAEEVKPENASDIDSFDPPQDWPSRGTVDIQEVSAAYKEYVICLLREHLRRRTNDYAQVYTRRTEGSLDTYSSRRQSGHLWQNWQV